MQTYGKAWSLQEVFSWLKVCYDIPFLAKKWARSDSSSVIFIMHEAWEVSEQGVMETNLTLQCRTHYEDNWGWVRGKILWCRIFSFHLTVFQHLMLTVVLSIPDVIWNGSFIIGYPSVCYATVKIQSTLGPRFGVHNRVHNSKSEIVSVTLLCWDLSSCP